MSLATLNRKTKEKYNNASVGKKQFSLHGIHRNQGWVGQTSLCRSTYVNTFSNNNNNIIKPSVVNASLVMKKKTLVKPFTIVKQPKYVSQSDHTVASRNFTLSEFSRLYIKKPILVGENCLTTKNVLGTTYGEHLFLLTKKCIN